MKADVLDVANADSQKQLLPVDIRARRGLAEALVQSGRLHESLPLFLGELAEGNGGVAWLQSLVSNAMRDRNLSCCGHFADILAFIRRSSPWRLHSAFKSLSQLPVAEPERYVSVGKLEHDIEQFRYLQSIGVFGQEIEAVINVYSGVRTRLRDKAVSGRLAMEETTQAAIGDVYSRLIHRREAPRLRKPFSNSWAAADVERAYLVPPGIVIIDDFLSEEALDSLIRFCLESTLWFENRYDHGRLGAFFQDGFNCPLLLQIAEELRSSLPLIIGEAHPLRQLWGFKNEANLPPNSATHADFAAVNVNFWITPGDANLDHGTGGLTIYGVDAPSTWDFATYNGRPDIIQAYLKENRAKAFHIPYRQNRAIIFNSDLFHGTSGITFKPGYENRRVNITMLYGERANDAHHLSKSRIESVPAWRSAAFSKVRHGSDQIRGL